MSSVWKNVKRVFSDVGKSVVPMVQGAVTGFMVGGPVGAVVGAGAGLATGIRANEMKESAENSIKNAEAAMAQGISSTIAMEKLFGELQIQNLTEAYNQTEEQIRERLRTDPAFIVDAWGRVENTLDPEITTRYGEAMNDLAEILTTGSTEAINALNQGFQQANQQMSESDRIILSSFDASNENLDTGLQRLQTKYGDVSGILSGVSGNIQTELSNYSQIAKQAYDSGSVEAARTLGKGSNEAINALTQGKTGAITAIDQGTQQQITTSQTGLREALSQGQPYATKGTEGLGAFADTALNPDSALFKRNLSIAQEDLNQQLASRGLLNSGAAIEAQSNLIQDMTMKEMERQTGLQKDLANMGLGQVGQQQGLIADATRNEIGAIAQQAGLRAGLEQSTAQNIANVATGTASQEANIQSQFAQQIGSLAQMTGEQKVNMLKDMGALDANYQVQSAQDMVKIDSMLANNAVQEGVARGEISQDIANNLMNQGLQTGNILGSLSTNLSSLGQSSAINQATLDQGYQNQLLGLRQEGLRGALTARDTQKNNIQDLPLNQFEDQYNIGRTNLTNLQNLEMGKANQQAGAFYAGAQRNMDQGNSAMNNFNTALQVAGTVDGAMNSGFGQQLSQSFQQGGFSGAGNFLKGAFGGETQVPNSVAPMSAPTSQINLPSSGVPTNLGNYGVTPFNPSTQSMPSMFDSTPTSNSFFNPKPSLQIEVLPNGGRGKAGFGPALNEGGSTGAQNPNVVNATPPPRYNTPQAYTQQPQPQGPSDMLMDRVYSGASMYNRPQTNQSYLGNEFRMPTQQPQTYQPQMRQVGTNQDGTPMMRGTGLDTSNPYDMFRNEFKKMGSNPYAGNQLRNTNFPRGFRQNIRRY